MSRSSFNVISFFLQRKIKVMPNQSAAYIF
nr:MAG TPA: hypothetical protein [Caudoviricetes sp.]